MYHMKGNFIQNKFGKFLKYTIAGKIDDDKRS